MSMLIRDSWMISMVRAGVRYAPQPARPQRMVATIDCDTNVILSREDRSEL